MPLNHNARIIVEYAAPRPPVARLKILHRPVAAPVRIVNQPRKIPPQTLNSRIIVTPRPVQIIAQQDFKEPLIRTMTSRRGRLSNNVRSVVRTPTPQLSGQANSLKGVGVGRILIIVGNGPSHQEAPLDLLKTNSFIDVMSINRPDTRIWPTKYWLFCDNSVAKRHHDLIQTYPGLIINSAAIRDVGHRSIRAKTLTGKGFSLDLRYGMFIGRTSVYAAMQVAYWMAYDHIYLFGVDMTKVGDKLYPWGSNPDVSDDSRMQRFKFEADHFSWMTTNTSPEVLKRYTFCTAYNPWPFIKAFEQLDHHMAVEEILKRHPIKSQV